MKKIIFLTLLLIITIYSFIHAKDLSIDDLTEAELIQKLMKIEKKIQNEKKKQAKARAKTEAIKKLGRTVDELSQKLGIQD